MAQRPQLVVLALLEVLEQAQVKPLLVLPVVLAEFRQPQVEPVALVAIVKTTQLVPWQTSGCSTGEQQVVLRLPEQEGWRNDGLRLVE